MQVQGNITSVSQATPPNDKGLMYQNIVVNTVNGELQGKIAFKKAAYVANTPFNGTGDPNPDGTYYFRKVNPQYANQPSQAPPASRTMPAPPQGQQPTYQPVKRDTGLSIERQACFKAACERYQGTDAANMSIVDLAILGANFVKTGKTHVSGNDDGIFNKPKTVGDQIGQGVTDEQAESAQAVDDSIPF